MKAYIRLDPLIDERKADYSPAELGAYIKVLCLAARQDPRGRFRSAKLLRGLLPPPYARLVSHLMAQGDVVEEPDGTVVVAGWDIWQEGDLTVAERMARLRNRKRNNCRNTGVTNGVPQPYRPAIGIDVDVDVDIDKGASAPFRARDGLPHITPVVQEAGESVTGMSILQASEKVLTDLDRLVETHGADAVADTLRAVADGKRMTWPQVVYGSRNRLEPIPGAPDSKLERERRERAEADARRQRDRRALDEPWRQQFRQKLEEKP